MGHVRERTHDGPVRRRSGLGLIALLAVLACAACAEQETRSLGPRCAWPAGAPMGALVAVQLHERYVLLSCTLDGSESVLAVFEVAERRASASEGVFYSTGIS